MLARKLDLIADALALGTGATTAVRVLETGRRKGLRIWFNDLDEKHGPVAELKPHGLKSHSVSLGFGSFSARVLEQISNASLEDVQLARSLVRSVAQSAEIDIPGHLGDEWLVRDGGFRIEALYRHDQNLPHEDAAIIETCREVIIPLMAAMAELIGYDVVEDPSVSEIPEVEGGLSRATVSRRERNPRNRLLCLRIHGAYCGCCRLDPKSRYGDAGGIIEVHHLEPVSMLGHPRPYDPETDLVPLCPNCHRAVHTRCPWPLTLEELAACMETGHA